MKKTKRFEVGFVFSVIIHAVIAIALAVFGFFTLTKDINDVVEVTMYEQTSGGDFAPTKAASQAPPKKVEVAKPEPVVHKDDIVDTKKTEKIVAPTPTQKTSENKEQKTTSTSTSESGGPNTKEGGTGPGGTGGKGGTTGGGNTVGAPPGPPIDAGVPITPPRFVSRPQPPYPSSARNNNITGTVYVSIVVGVSGGVESVSLAGSSGNSALDNAAVNGVYRWRFSPAKDRYGTPCRSRVSSAVQFKLR